MTASLVYDCAIPLSSQHLTLDLPESDALWTAISESEWQHQLIANVSVPQPDVTFQLALCTLLSCDTVHGDTHETATVFGQYILLCGITDAFNTARRLPMNYSSADGFRTGAMSAFGPRSVFLESLNIWKTLWWSNLDCNRDKASFAFPGDESVFLLNHLYVALSHNCLEVSHIARESVAAAIEVFCGASKAGFLEVCDPPL